LLPHLYKRLKFHEHAQENPEVLRMLAKKLNPPLVGGFSLMGCERGNVFFQLFFFTVNLAPIVKQSTNFRELCKNIILPDC